MLKLKYLFDNRDLAIMLLENWDYDKNELDFLDYYRISANAIYPYKNNGEMYFLRFAPYEESVENEINSEIKFIQYLLEKGLNVLEPILSKNGKYFLIKETPWGKYLVCSFKRVVGDRLDGFNSDGIDYNDELINGYGKMLGKLHKHSSEYGKVVKKSCFNIIKEMGNQLKKLKINNLIIENELNNVKGLLENIPQNKLNFGLIHGDYELDNVFFDKNLNIFSIIDFGSSLYSWYAMDIEISLNNLKEELPQINYEKMKRLFINGYNKEFVINEEDKKNFSIFRRFENIRKYIGLKISLGEKWDNEPLWMIELREKLEKYLIELENEFYVLSIII